MFDEVLEAKAKKMANSFLDELDRKYNKINHGVTCTEYDTTMCWTSAMLQKRNLTIDHYYGFYMIREQKVDRLFSDNTRIYRFLVSEAILKCFQLIDCCYSEDSVFHGYNTDGTHTHTHIYIYVCVCVCVCVCERESKGTHQFSVTLSFAPKCSSDRTFSLFSEKVV